MCMGTQDKELIGASTELLILRCLESQPSYGYEIVRQANERSDGLFVWQEGTIYPVLHKLKEEKLVRSQWQTSDLGRRRNYYYITAKGRKALEEKSRKWKALNEMLFGSVSLGGGLAPEGS